MEAEFPHKMEDNTNLNVAAIYAVQLHSRIESYVLKNLDGTIFK